MKTKLLYLEDTYCFAVHAHCVDSGVDERGPYLILDETLFYPQGGGQPADSGVISISGVELPVQFAGFVEGA
ncbi:MAG TPA: alanyl-tRNA editing protein, partial [Opitutae bacterium]|nr:alanyl-tRNA editing protein [Opitutae bacterium]